jgi:predicted tellurium resistance membrane protein TerC
MNRDFIYLTHILLSAPVFLYLGHMKGQGPEWVYHIAVVLGIIVLLYHAYLLANKYNSMKMISWVNLIHILLVAPILIYVGLNKNNVLYPFWQVCLILGYGVLVNFIIMYLK